MSLFAKRAKVFSNVICYHRCGVAGYSTKPFSANGKDYNPPNRPLAVICIDGCENDYLETSIAQNYMPHLSELLYSNKIGFRFMSRGCLPSFTNVNNAAIISGLPPFKTGISGNFFVDENDNEIMMNSNKYLNCENILENALFHGNRKVGLVTAKDKLRDLCGGNNIVKHENGISLSTEFLKKADFETNGIDYSFIINNLMQNDSQFIDSYESNTFDIYSGDASIFALKLGVKLIEHEISDFVYLSLSDYIQHKHAPNDIEALQFYKLLDAEIGKLIDLNCVVGITADHGMNDKPEIIYLQNVLNQQFNNNNIRVICPITDPYVVHHGSLGSFVYVYINNTDNIDLDEFNEYKLEVIEFVKQIKGITEVYDKDEATVVLQLPYDRIGDITVISDKHIALGKTEQDHQLNHIKSGLRTHGGRTEEMVPFIVLNDLNDKYLNKHRERELRNFNIFEYTCNGTH